MQSAGYVQIFHAQYGFAYLRTALARVNQHVPADHHANNCRAVRIFHIQGANHLTIAMTETRLPVCFISSKRCEM